MNLPSAIFYPVHSVSAMLKFIDRFLNATTMYRLVLYCLGAMVTVAAVLGYAGLLYPGGTILVLSLVLISLVCWLSNHLFAWLWRVPVNTESMLITAFILFFLMLPAITWADAGALALSGVLAMASKYVIARHAKHVFNPAALAAVIVAVTGLGYPTWWIGTTYMLPVVAIGGFLIVRKIRRFEMVLACIVASMLTVIPLAYVSDEPVLDVLWQHFASWPIIFFATVMVTEPFTTPPLRRQQILYGALIGAVSSWPLHIGSLYSTPELVLVIANLYAYAVSLRRRLTLTLTEKRELVRGTFEFVFDTPVPLRFLPGQYLEWTLGHPHTDNRGNRRYFTIASSPTEKTINLGVKIGDKASSFKQALLAFKPGDTIQAGQLRGDFLLPKEPDQKLVLIAGGIGVTPFRSMIQYLIDTKDTRDVVLYYGNRSLADTAYREFLAGAGKKIGLKTIYVLDDPAGLSKEEAKMTASRITEELIEQFTPDYRDRMFYLSGPNAMVDAFKSMLKRMGVQRRRIVTDYFPGFA